MAAWTKASSLNSHARLFHRNAARGRGTVLGHCACAPGAKVSGDCSEGMKTLAGRGAPCSDRQPKLGLCVLCGLPAAGKSTFARALALRLRRERGWAVGVLSYDDVLPLTLLDGAGSQPRVSIGSGRTGLQAASRPGS